MRLCTRTFTTQGLLCLTAFALASGMKAIAMKPAFVQPAGIGEQETQHSQQKPDMQQSGTPSLTSRQPRPWSLPA